MTKQEVIEAIGIKDFDWARPIEWDKQAKDLGINPDDYIWNYDGDSLFGEPVNIYAAYVETCENVMMP